MLAFENSENPCWPGNSVMWLLCFSNSEIISAAAALRSGREGQGGALRWTVTVPAHAAGEEPPRGFQHRPGNSKGGLEPGRSEGSRAAALTLGRDPGFLAKSPPVTFQIRSRETGDGGCAPRSSRDDVWGGLQGALRSLKQLLRGRGEPCQPMTAGSASSGITSGA